MGAEFDLVIGAVPGFMGFKTLKTVIEAGKNIVDISFMPEDFLLLDKYDKATETISMSRTTGYTCTAAANLLLDGGFSEFGVHPPETLGAGAGNLAYIMKYLKERGVQYSVIKE